MKLRDLKFRQAFDHFIALECTWEILKTAGGIPCRKAQMEPSCVRVTDHDQSGLPVLEGCKIMDDDVAPAFSQPLSDDEKEALDLWVNGLGNSAKRFAGEDPMPSKRRKASRNSWHIR